MLIDAHAHVDRFGPDRSRALTSAVREIRDRRIPTVANSMDTESFERIVSLAAGCPWILPAFGIHPWNAPHYADRLRELDGLADRAPVIGEIGLDRRFVDDPACYPAQEKVFRHLLVKAKARNKIVILHTAGAESESLSALEESGNERVVVHWYSGPADIFSQMADRGFYFTVGLEVWHSDRIQRIAREIPAERLLSETDNPGGPKWLTGKPGNPMLIREVVRGLARIRRTSVRVMEETIQRNFLELIGRDPALADFRKRIEGWEER
jgi:TatD DNase family protein